MTPKETVQALYAAYASADPQRIDALLHANAIWIAPAGNATQVALGLGSPRDAGPPRGANNLTRSEIVQFMAHNFSRFFLEVRNDFLSLIAEGNVVIAEHRLSATLPNGRSYVNDYCFVYEVDAGKVRKIREYMDTRGGWEQVFGGDEPRQILEFIRG